jgi:hypothetical protein
MLIMKQARTLICWRHGIEGEVATSVWGGIHEMNEAGMNAVGRVGFPTSLLLHSAVCRRQHLP